MLLNIINTICDNNVNLGMLLLNCFILIVLISSFIFVRESRKRWNKITDYLDFALWNKDAKRIMKLSKQGALIHLEGAMQPKDIEVGEQKIRTINLKVNKYKHLANKKDLSAEPIEETKTEEMVK